MYNCLQGRDMMSNVFCREFAVIFAIFTKVCRFLQQSQQSLE